MLYLGNDWTELHVETFTLPAARCDDVEGVEGVGPWRGAPVVAARLGATL